MTVIFAFLALKTEKDQAANALWGIFQILDWQNAKSVNRLANLALVLMIVMNAHQEGHHHNANAFKDILNWKVLASFAPKTV